MTLSKYFMGDLNVMTGLDNIYYEEIMENHGLRVMNDNKELHKHFLSAM